MAEELQGLLDRIQRDGIEKADTEAAQIVKSAKSKAAELVKQAEVQAAALISKAEEDGKLFQKRGESAIAQAARDVVLSVADSITKTLQGIVSTQVDKALSGDDFATIVKQAVEAYCSNEAVEVLVSPEQQEQVTALFMQQMAEQMKSGLSVKGDKNVVSGFVVSMQDSGVHHDFTGTTLTHSFCSLLRPKLAEIVKQAMANGKS
jgi:V/A-type H+-transporting ATPase subunit E